ncbi:MAG: TIGR02281 family clan AA aspartic protease [Gammaproteobacteria bacterium]|nr:TIGR02281 family clan AA aspartic protease [Gammaproteobacteria bacterium]
MKLIFKFLVSSFFVICSQAAPAIEKINILGLFKNKAIVRVDGKQRILEVGKTSPEGIILVSANSKEAILEIEGEQNTYTLGSHIGSKFKAAEGGKTSTIAPDSNGMYWVSGSINGFQMSFIVDTGATLISMNKHDAKRIGLNYKLEGRVSSANTASGVSKIYIMNLDKVKVGDIEVRDIEGAIHDSDFPKVTLLGNTFLNKVNMKREGQLLQLESRR